MTNTGRSFRPLKPIERRISKKTPRGFSRSKVVITCTNLATVRNVYQVPQQESIESLPSFEPSVATMDGPMNHMLHPSGSFPPYHPVVDMPPNRTPSFPTPSRYRQGYSLPFFRAQGNERHVPTVRYPHHSQIPPEHPSHLVPSWAGSALRGDPQLRPGFSHWKHSPLAYQSQYCSGYHQERPDSTVKDGTAYRPILLDTTVDIVATESQEERSSTRQLKETEERQASPTPLTPQPLKVPLRDDLDGKKLVLAVSASPTTSVPPRHHEHHHESRGEESAATTPIPDSPGQAFLSSFMDDMTASGGMDSMDNFSFLPYLVDEAGQNRASPPLIPFLSSESVQLSWEQAVDPDQADAENEAKGNAQSLPKMPPLQLKPKSQMPLAGEPAFRRNGASDTQSLFHEDALVFGNARSIREDETFDSEETSERTHRYWDLDESGAVILARKMSRDDVESEEPGAIDSREAPQMSNLSTPVRPSLPFPREHLTRLLPQPTQTVAFARPSHFAMPLRPNGPPLRNTKPAFRPGVEASRSFPSQMYQTRPPISKGRCVPLNNPVPTVDQSGSTESPLPDFSELVNFPNNLRESRALPAGMKCCVMCGVIRPTCSRLRSRKNKDNRTMGLPSVEEMGVSYSCEDFVTIPTQNKGLCTLCDISVWVVEQNGCQIKWCKGCKNFRQWSSFGDKGFATKCARCRERQREKYALIKDAKMNGTTVHHVEKRKANKKGPPRA